MHHASYDGKYVTVTVTDYHGEYPFARTVLASQGRLNCHVLTLWDGPMGGEVAEAVGPKTTTRIFRNVLHGMPEPMNFYIGTDAGCTVYRLWGRADGILTDLQAYASVLERDAREGGPGADDGTYDYFPGAVEQCRQIALAFIELDLSQADDARQIYNSLVLTARDTHYEGNEEADDLLPFLPIP